MKDEEILLLLEKIMFQNDWNQEKLAQEIGTSRGSLYFMFQKRRKISKRMRFKIEEFLKKNSK